MLVVEIDKIQWKNGETWTDAPNPLVVAKGTTVSFKAIPNPSGAAWPSGKPVWGGTAGASGTGETKDVTFNTVSSNATDFKTVTAECGNTKTVNVLVVEIDKIQWKNGDTWTDAPNPLVVAKGTTISFKAIPNPSGAAWPSGKPVWGGTAGASGTGETKDVTFNTVSSNATDFKTVTAECGNTKTVNVLVVEVKLIEVSFSGTKNHTVKSDNGVTNYTAPHWQDKSSPYDGDADDSGDRKYPICYTRNTKMTVTVKWHIEPANVTATLKAKGDGPGNLDFPETTAVINGTEMTITNVECENKLANEVDYLAPMELVWRLSLNGSTVLHDAGKNSNVVYVLLADPVAVVPIPEMFETLLDITCRNGDGETSASDLATKAYSEFTDKVVKRKLDNKTMTYWLNGDCGGVATNQILSSDDANGNCQAWSGLFRDALRLHGLEAHRVMLTPLVVPGDNGILVNNWHFEAAAGVANVVKSGVNGIANTTKAGDDVQVIDVGNGLPHATAITAGANLDTTPAGDDGVVGTTIHTGTNGICQTSKVGKDTQNIEVGNGQSNQTCVNAGVNLVTTPVGNDQVNGNTITTGADGICDTAKAGNDTQVIDVGNGAPNTIAITAGDNGILDTTAAIGDQVDGNTIKTGANGKCESTAAGDDVQVIPVNQGQPNQVCINAGTNLVTTIAGDDIVMGNTIHTGDNGICETVKAGNDIQVINAGQGKANATAITAGIKLVTTPGGDDVVMNEIITAGANGKCETTKSGNDVQVLANGNGAPNSVIITAGANKTINSTPAVDDAVATIGARPVPDPAPRHPYTALRGLRNGIDAWPTTGVTGQGNSYPPPSFNGHWITKWQDGATFKYFDPSYGSAVITGATVNEAIKTYEDTYLAGYRAINYPVPAYTYVPLRKNNLTAKDVIEYNAD